MTAGKRVVVLGGSGFVGRHLVARLRAAGHAVTVLSRNGHLCRHTAVEPGVPVVTLDVYDPDALARAFVGADAAVNLVGILNEPGFGGSGFERAHVVLTSHVISACLQSGTRRLLQMSALNAGRGSSHYLRTRGIAESRVRESGLDWTIFQPSVIFGRGDGLFQRFAALLRIAPVLPLAKPDARFAPVYVGDVAEAITQCLARPQTVGQCFELYGDQVLRLREIVSYTARCMGLRRWVIGLPDWAARMQAMLMDFVPGKPFSTDNYRSLQVDSVGGVDGLFQLGIAKTPIDAVVPPLLGHAGRQVELDALRARLR
ncbi:MAG: complex I NDUFA9 subunit family protein [Xanthomonadales bacterium]|nr:complex I NDUFA9 subunit family protein [Xanthomonadales bacterium]